MKESNDGYSRREFIRKTSYGLIGTLAYQLFPFSNKMAAAQDTTPRQGMGNLFIKNGKPLLVVVEGNDRTTRLKKGLERIGGLEKLVKGKTVILKLNAVAPGPYPVASDPDFVITVGKSAIDAGAKKVSIYDGVSERMFQQMGLYEKVQKSGLAIELLPKDGSFPEFFTPVEKKSWEVRKKIDVSIHLKEADVVINVPNVKRHGEAGFTCAMKNNFGSVYGLNRWEAHMKLNKGGSMDSKVYDESFRIPFKKLSAEFSDAVRCELNVVDAQDLLIKWGPFLDGAEVKKGINRLIICGDIVATDSYCSQLMAKNDPSYTTDLWEPVLQHGEKLGLGIADLKKVEIIEV